MGGDPIPNQFSEMVKQFEKDKVTILDMTRKVKLNSVYSKKTPRAEITKEKSYKCGKDEHLLLTTTGVIIVKLKLSGY